MSDDDKFGYWYAGLEPHEDEDGASFYFAIDLDDDEARKDPRDLLVHLIEVAMYVLDHDLLEGSEVEE